METKLVRERYKIVRVLYAEEEYALVEAVDIQDRETPVYLLNLYGGTLLHRYGRIYANLHPEQCPAFQRIFLEEETLVTVFTDRQGYPIDQLFYQRDSWNWQERLAYTEYFLHEALQLESLPPEVGCAALQSENVLIVPLEKKVRLRFAVIPMEEMNDRELALLAGDQVQKFLPERLTSPDAERVFLAQLRRGTFRTVVMLYSAWHAAREQISAEYEEWEQKNWLQKGLTLFKRIVKRRKTA